MSVFLMLSAFATVSVSLYEQIQSLKFNKKSIILLHERIEFLHQHLKKMPEEKLEVAKLEKVVGLIKDVDFWVRTRLADRNVITQMMDAPIILKTIQRYDSELVFYLQQFHIDMSLEHDLKAAHKDDLEALKKELTAKMDNQNARMDQVLNDLCISRNQEVSSMYALSQIMDQNLIQSNKLDKLLQYLQQRSGRHIKQKLKFTAIPWHDIKLDYQQPIGKGSYGEVYKGKWEGYDVAIKQSLNEVIGNDSVQEIEREINNWFPIRHPNVACLWGGFLNTDKPYLVMKFYKHGSASDFLLRHNPSISLRTQFILDIAQGMNHLHSQHSLIHGDLKGDNVLIDEVDFNYRCVITDFGLSRLRNCNSSAQTGATRWIAPERYDVTNTHDRTKLDVFAFAMTAYQLLLSEFPWPREMDSAVITKLICANQRPEPYAEKAKMMYSQVHQRVWMLVRECWDQDPNKRPGFGEIVSSLKDIIAEKKLDGSILDLEMNLSTMEKPLADSGTALSSKSVDSVDSVLATTSSPSKDKKTMKSLTQDVNLKSKSADHDFEFNTPILRSRLSKLDLNCASTQFPVPLINKGSHLKPTLLSTPYAFEFDTPKLSKMKSTGNMSKFQPPLLPPKTITATGFRSSESKKIYLELTATNFGQNTDFQGELRQDGEEAEKLTGFLRADQFVMVLNSSPMRFKGLANIESKIVRGRWYSLGYGGDFELRWP